MNEFFAKNIHRIINYYNAVQYIIIVIKSEIAIIPAYKAVKSGCVECVQLTGPG